MLGFFPALLLAAATLNVTVTAPQSGTSFTARPEQCVDIYTAAQGNPGCIELYDANDNAVGGGPVADSNSGIWLTKQSSGTPGLSDVSAPIATQPGGTNYGKDPAQAMFYNPNGKASISTAGMTNYVVSCNNAQGSCGHSWTGETVYLTAGARAQNPNSDHHISGQNNPCDPNGKSQPANPPPYTIASGDRCERDHWLAQPGYPTIVPSSNTPGTALTVEGEGQCDEDAVLGFYNCSGSTASNLPEGMDMNPADLVAAVQANSFLPYALFTAAFCTENVYEFPSSYFDGYESANGCPPNGFRYWSDITDAQVNATSWPIEKKVIMRTLHHYGGIIFDTTGGNGPGLSIQMIGGSGFTVGQSTDSDSLDPVAWLADTANGGSGVQTISDDDAGNTTGLDISLGSLSPYSVTSDFHICAFGGTTNHAYVLGNTLPKTCGNL